MHVFLLMEIQNFDGQWWAGANDCIFVCRDWDQYGKTQCIVFAHGNQGFLWSMVGLSKTIAFFLHRSGSIWRDKMRICFVKIKVFDDPGWGGAKRLPAFCIDRSQRDKNAYFFSHENQFFDGPGSAGAKRSPAFCIDRVAGQNTCFFFSNENQCF